MVEIEDRETTANAIDMLGAIFACDPLLDEQASELFGVLADMSIEDTASDWPYVPVDASEPLLNDMKGAASQDLGPLAKEYRHLFVGPNALEAPPYGSVYTDPDEVLFGESTLALRSWLDEVGIGIESDEAEPEDHIGTMFSLWAWLIRVKPELIEDYLSKHLLTWAPHYLEELEEAAGDGFYRALAALARMTLVGAQEQLGLQVTLPRYYR